MAVAASALRARPAAAAAPPATSIRTTVLATVVLIALPTAARFVVTQQMVGLLLVLYVAALAPWIVKSPVRGIYVAVACAAVFNITPVLIPDSLVDLVPVFMNLNNTQYSAGLPVAITPFELLLVVTTVGVIVQSGTALVTRPTGSILAAYAAYFAIVVFAEFHGLFGGGDFNTSLWELRPQAYGFMLCVLAAAAVRERRQLLTLTVVATTAITVKMLIASVRYLTVRDTSVYGEDIMAHEESFFAATILVGLIVALLFVRRRRLVLAYLALSVPAAVALLANQRRAGVVALEVAAAIVLALAIRFERPVRGRLVALAAFLGVAGLIAVVVLWNHQTGMIGQIERPFHTLVGDVTPRDYSSNMYRIAEDFNIKFTWRQSVLYGVGFGSPMTVVFPMADISYLYPLWNVIPHNSVLWILMRMGVVGFVAFWGLIGVALGRAVEVVRLHADLLTVCLATAIVAVIGMEIIVGYTDVQWENYRNLIFFGVALGIIEPMRRLAMKAPAARSEEAA